jgi:hypothetical protein
MLHHGYRLEGDPNRQLRLYRPDGTYLGATYPRSVLQISAPGDPGLAPHVAPDHVLGHEDLVHLVRTVGDPKGPAPHTWMARSTTRS